MSPLGQFGTIFWPSREADALGAIAYWILANFDQFMGKALCSKARMMMPEFYLGIPFADASLAAFPRCPGSGGDHYSRGLPEFKETKQLGPAKIRKLHRLCLCV